jgi:thioredoxin 2
MAAGVATCTVCRKRNRVPVVARGRPRCAQCKADLAWVVDADTASFAGAIDARGVVIVDLWAAWCGPCRMVAPVLQRLAERYAGRLKVVKVDVDAEPQLATRFRAQSIPLLVMLRNGVEVDRLVGAQPEHVLAARIDQLLTP